MALEASFISGLTKMLAVCWDTWPLTTIWTGAVLLAGILASRDEGATGSPRSLFRKFATLFWATPIYLWGIETILEIIAWGETIHPTEDKIYPYGFPRRVLSSLFCLTVIVAAQNVVLLALYGQSGPRRLKQVPVAWSLALSVLAVYSCIGFIWRVI